ncbi:hypothetical protein ACFWG0_34960 [Streptomyces yangpuensis]|uniref:hypothetical protein n=1 Tax=Streptomyces yangpuensis TaxID=1648182 RepID=UPI0036609656
MAASTPRLRGWSEEGEQPTGQEHVDPAPAGMGLGEDAERMGRAGRLRGHLGEDVLAVLMRDTGWSQVARQLVGALQNVADQRHFGWDQLLLGCGGYVSASCDPSSMIDEYEKLLAGLDDVDWAGLSHAYRSAHDVPGRIRALCGSDDEARKEAFSSLFSSIFHQGSRYSASLASLMKTDSWLCPRERTADVHHFGRHLPPTCSNVDDLGRRSSEMDCDGVWVFSPVVSVPPAGQASARARWLRREHPLASCGP